MSINQILNKDSLSPNELVKYVNNENYGKRKSLVRRF